MLLTPHDLDSPRKVWEHEYDDMPFYTKARKGQRVAHDLAEQRVNLPAGRYSVYVSVREDAGMMDEHGNVVAAALDRDGGSVVVEVR